MTVIYSLRILILFFNISSSVSSGFIFGLNKQANKHLSIILLTVKKEMSYFILQLKIQTIKVFFKVEYLDDLPSLLIYNIESFNLPSFKLKKTYIWSKEKLILT